MSPTPPELPTGIPTDTPTAIAVARQRRSRRRLAIVAAAIFVGVVPTACDVASAQPARPPSAPVTGSNGQEGGQSGHAGHTTGVVPVGNTVDATATDEPEDSDEDTRTRRPGRNRPTEPSTAPTTAPATTAAPTDAAKPDAPNNGLDVLGRDCKGSDLEPHKGFQDAPACVSTAFGEVADEDKSPSLLITEAPRVVRTAAPFTISVSTRNLVRDRFLGAAAGGYYLESSFLNEDGLQRGHFHTACRMLDRTDSAPDSGPPPAFFLATQDKGGGAEPDTVTITVTGLPAAGTAQCAVWAGDGSHRVPMMQRANQTPAFDAVRISVR